MRTGLWDLGGYLVDSSFLGRGIYLYVGYADVLPEALFLVGIDSRDERAVVKIEAERIDVAHEEPIFSLVDLIERLGLVRLYGRDRLFEHCLSVSRGALRICRCREKDSST